MFKNISFVFFTLFAFGTSHEILASAQTSSAAAPVQSMPATAANPASTDKEAHKQPVKIAPSNNEKIIDYRYCLDLKNNHEIAECRYKK